MVKSMSETNARKRQQSITHFKRVTVLLTFLYQEKRRTEFDFNRLTGNKQFLFFIFVKLIFTAVYIIIYELFIMMP